MTEQTTIQHAGLAALMQRPLIEMIFRRRTHCVSRGSSLSAGSMSYTSAQPRPPLIELEEAVLISLTGCTGLTMPDRPFADPRNGMPIMAKPNLTMAGRTAGSPDNAQGTTSFLINDRGTYFLRKLPPPDGGARFSTSTSLSPGRARRRCASSITASTCPSATATSRRTWTPTASCLTCPAPRSWSPSSTSHINTQRHDVPPYASRRCAANNC
jgi:hypothetical protein